MSVLQEEDAEDDDEDEREGCDVAEGDEAGLVLRGVEEVFGSGTSGAGGFERLGGLVIRRALWAVAADAAEDVSTTALPRPPK